MATQVRFRRGNTSSHSTFTGAAGEMTIDTTKNTCVVHDGSTAGGFPLATEADVANCLGNVVEDDSPQLGADLDTNNNDIVMRSGGTDDSIRFVYDPDGSPSEQGRLSTGGGSGSGVLFIYAKQDLVLRNNDGGTYGELRFNSIEQTLRINNITDYESLVLNDDDIPNKKYVDDSLASRSRKNLLINGDFDVWQRGTSFSSQGQYTADRWLYSASGTPAVTLTQQTFALGQTAVPNNPKYYLRYSGTHSVAGWNLLRQPIEGVQHGAGKTVTVSVWLKANTAVTGALSVVQTFGSGGSPSANVINYGNISVTTSWARYSRTVTLASISGKTLGTNGNDYLAVDIGLPQSTTATVDIAQVQFEIGGEATDFEKRLYGEELAMCQRYYETNCDSWATPGNGTHIPNLSHAAVSGTGGRSLQLFKVNKRITPSITMYSGSIAGSGGAWAYYNGAWLATTSTVAQEKDQMGFNAVLDGFTGFGAGEARLVNGGWTADAEL